MQREEVIAILRFYRDIPQRMKLNEREMHSLRTRYGIGKKDIPHGILRSLHVLEQANNRLEQICFAICSELDRLNYYQKEVIHGFYIDNQRWEDVSARVCYSIRQCKNIRDAALCRLAELFSQNQVISTYRFPD